MRIYLALIITLIVLPVHGAGVHCVSVQVNASTNTTATRNAVALLKDRLTEHTSVYVNPDNEWKDFQVTSTTENPKLGFIIRIPQGKEELLNNLTNYLCNRFDTYNSYLAHPSYIGYHFCDINAPPQHCKVRYLRRK